MRLLLHVSRSCVLAVAFLTVLALGGSLLGADTCNGQVRINEILADPGRDWDGDGTVSFKNDEWIEIVNAGTSAVSLDEYRLSDAGPVSFRYGFSGVLAPGALRLVRGSDSVSWESANGASTVGLSLNNSGDTVRLWQLAGTDTLLVDQYAYASFEVLKDRSTGRMPDGGASWQVFDGLNPYSGTTPPLGTGCMPTPAVRNGCPTPIESVTWSAVKSLFEGQGDRGKR